MSKTVTIMRITAALKSATYFLTIKITVFF